MKYHKLILFCRHHKYDIRCQTQRARNVYCSYGGFIYCIAPDDSECRKDRKCQLVDAICKLGVIEESFNGEQLEHWMDNKAVEK